MQLAKVPGTNVQTLFIDSSLLDREVRVDIYIPEFVTDISETSLLILNDGQDLVKMDFGAILSSLNDQKLIEPLTCIGIHCGPDRKMEYGIAGTPDYKGRGAQASNYTTFIFEELLPLVRESYNVSSFREKAFAGFSLGGLMALDIVWNHPKEFSKAGIFSGSLWWREVDQSDEKYDDELHRIMHKQIKNGQFSPWQKFFFECGTMDETKDRNNNGVIDSIDDTQDLIKDLISKGFDRNRDIFYLEIEGGRHDVSTWAKALPAFLKWGWRKRE